MKQYQPDSIRNVVLLAHSGAGKTALTEAALFSEGAITRLGKVDDGSTTSDYDPDEIKRKISINLTPLPGEWRDTKINLLDTPGYADFTSEVRAAIRVAEGAVIVICAASGIEVGSEQSWSHCEESGLARLIWVNKMDRENADFFRTFEQIQAKFGVKCAPLQLPIGSQSDFKGVVDLLTMKGYLGPKAEATDVPADIAEQAGSLREKLIEAVAETDDNLIEKYLGGEELTTEELIGGLKKGVAAGNIVPVLAGSATQNVGVSFLLDMIVNYLPSPKERDIMTADGPAGGEFAVAPDAPLAALVFKTSADPYVGKLTFFRVYSGTLASNSQVWNVPRGEQERIGQLFMLRGKVQEPVTEVTAGDIGGVAKLGVTNTGDTLGTKDKPVKIAPVVFPAPIFSEAVHPKSKADVDKLGASLARLAEEDPTLHIHRDPDTGETIMSGMGDTQLDVAADRMQRKFGVNVEMDTPKVPYKETITAPANAEYKHKKQSGGHGQYGHVRLKLEPLPRSGGHEFADQIVGGAIPKNYIPSVEKGVNEALQEGTLGGFPVVDVKATLYDGSFHPVDSSDICFKIAGSGAMKRGLADGRPILLEPIMNIRVTVPEEFTGDIISDLNGKRARVQGMNPEGSVNVIDAQVPQAEVMRYAIDLKSITQGRGSFTIEFSHYEETPQQVSQKVITEKQAEKEKAG